ncbi:2-C-methyl-D-erythritol 4-phosphate cytidylyltransferase [Paenibacillus turicensis]|uniref:2-C-methyl-D-erythritol 4-phosphate cytidylyltransferase n=1 Tax=Paenibacillus turicensis TaxID=160487 RepID=UPI003D2914D7
MKVTDGNQEVGVIIVAAGRGTRMGTKESKQYLMLKSKPIIVHTLEKFHQHPLISQIVLVTGKADIARCESWIKQYGLQDNVQVVEGGNERQHSVYQGLRAISTPWVLVHDGVRPFVADEHITSCFVTAKEYGAAVLAVPVKDTIKQVNEHGEVIGTPKRESLWAIQTPQAFRASDLARAHEKASLEGFVGTDDAMLIERLGMQVKVVEGDYSNVKITTPDDLIYAEFITSRNNKGELTND